MIIIEKAKKGKAKKKKSQNIIFVGKDRVVKKKTVKEPFYMNKEFQQEIIDSIYDAQDYWGH